MRLVTDKDTLRCYKLLHPVNYHTPLKSVTMKIGCKEMAIIEAPPKHELLTDHLNETWQAPAPIMSNIEHTAPYPIQALPPIIQRAITTYQKYGQQPISLIACSALANVSLACQTLANVARDRMLVSPVSLFFLVVAGSGERKSAADYMFSKATRQWQLNAREQLEPDVKIAITLHQAWRVEKEGVLNQIRRSSLLGSEAEVLREYLVNLVSNEPAVPLLPVLFFEDATQEALASHIGHGWPSASLWSDEGGIVMGGHGMQTNTTKFIALLNRLWDGKPFIAHRKTSKSFTVANRRLTVSLMMQPLILEQMLAKNGGISRQSGFLARSLIAYPKTAMGHRYYQEPPETLAALPEFHQRLTDCLDRSLSLDKTGCHTIPTLILSPQAKATWVSFFNQIEAGLKHSNQWQTIKDFASKAAENVARLAALFHLFEGREGDISVEQVERASEVIYWHLNETKMILGKQPQNPIQDDSSRLLGWIIDKGLSETTPRYLQQFSPIRDKAKRDLAIKNLSELNYLRTGKIQGKTIIIINPYLQKIE